MDINNKRPKHPPKYCPNCGGTDINYVECYTNFRGNIVWDTYCKTCDWSGDVRPDTDLDYYRIQAQESHEVIKEFYDL